MISSFDIFLKKILSKLILYRKFREFNEIECAASGGKIFITLRKKFK